MYTFNTDFDKSRLRSLIIDFESSVKRQQDLRLARKLRRELLDVDPPQFEHKTALQLAKWCNTDNPLYWGGMEVARKISQLLFGCVLDRRELNV